MRKLLAFAVILLFICGALSSGITAYNKSSSGNTIYVDDDNTMGPWDGTQEHPYQFIQDGIGAVEENGTVYIYNGTYKERFIIVNKSLSLTGEDKKNTIIDGSGLSILEIQTSNVVISGFTLKRADSWYGSGMSAIIIGIEKSYIENINITDCILKNNHNSVLFRYSVSNILIDKCVIHNNTGASFSDQYDTRANISNLSIMNCVIENNGNIAVGGHKHRGGIYLNDECGNGIIIINCTIHNNNFGILLKIATNGKFEIKNNKIYENSGSGIYIDGVVSEGIIAYNKIYNNGNGAILNGGIWLCRTQNVSVYRNNITSNNQSGICITPLLDTVITENNFKNNVHNGYFLQKEDFLFHHSWKDNYWDDWKGIGPYLIKGYIEGFELIKYIPWINFDWHPAKEPYELVVRIEVGPYTQNVNDDSITVVWETNIPTTDNYIMFGETTGYEHIMQGESNCCHHEITITPSFSLGYYKVVSDNEKSNDLTFKLASHCHTTQEFKCVIIGDSRGTWDNWENAAIVANAVNEESPDFVIHGGDMVTDGTNLSEWDSWLTLMKPLMQNSTVFGVMGNHERKGSRYYELFALPNNEKWYCFDYGPCHFIVLDNYELWNVGSSQYEWLEEDLQTTDKPFKIICFHEPIYCSGGHSPRTDVRDVWEPLFNKYNVNLVFQSHCHYYQRTNDINGTTYIVSGGAGAPLYTPKDAWFVNNSQKAYHYCVLDVSLATMEITFSARYVNGTTFDEFIVCPSFVS